jgi:hypothetical protein
MPLQIGDQDASSGMAKAIYDQMRALLEPGLEGLAEDKKAPIRDSWKKIAFAVSRGVIEHVTANMEIFGVRCSGNVNASVTGNTGVAAPTHAHTVALSGVQNGVVFTQSNDGTGHVR